MLIQAKCRSYNIMVKHHKKNEKVKSHLNCCAPFKATMKGVSANDFPTWFTTWAKARANHWPMALPHCKSRGHTFIHHCKGDPEEPSRCALLAGNALLNDRRFICTD
jgi:hypothetical protein